MSETTRPSSILRPLVEELAERRERAKLPRDRRNVVHDPVVEAAGDRGVRIVHDQSERFHAAGNAAPGELWRPVAPAAIACHLGLRDPPTVRKIGAVKVHRGSRGGRRQDECRDCGSRKSHTLRLAAALRLPGSSGAEPCGIMTWP